MPPHKLPAHRQHNYVAVVEQFAAAHVMTPGELNMIEVMLDDWCGVHDGGRCNCNPVVRWARPAERN